MWILIEFNSCFIRWTSHVIVPNPMHKLLILNYVLPTSLIFWFSIKHAYQLNETLFINLTLPKIIIWADPNMKIKLGTCEMWHIKQGCTICYNYRILRVSAKGWIHSDLIKLLLWQFLRMWTLHLHLLKSSLMLREKVHRLPNLTIFIWMQWGLAWECAVFR